MKIVIHEAKDHAWCEIGGSFIYGRSSQELKSTLDNVFGEGQEIKPYETPSLSCNR